VVKENLPVQFAFRDPASFTVRLRNSVGSDAEDFRWSLENFEREAGMLVSLDQPGIVKVLRSFEANGTAYFVMPFVEGQALDEVLRGRAGGGWAGRRRCCCCCGCWMRWGTWTRGGSTIGTSSLAIS